MAKKIKELSAFDRFELDTFDAATVFTCGSSRGRGNRITLRFTTLQEAVEAYEKDNRSVVYAVSPAGRSIVLDGAKHAFWLARYAANAASYQA